MAEKKEKQYVSDNAQLMAEWDFAKNKELGYDPQKLTCNSGKKAFWKCCKGHEWLAVIHSRYKGHGCPCCSGHSAIKGENDLLTINPELAQEWNYDKNIGLFPTDVLPNSNKKVWWRCSKGHEWNASVNQRNRGSNCPYCSGRYAIIGENDLQTINPTLSQEWNYEKNNGLTPMDVKSNSGKKVWWKCKNGHEWVAQIKSRNNGHGCPYCYSERRTSFPEYAIVYYLNRCGLDVVHLYKEKGYELDVYIPSKMIAIEYDGGFWHENKVQKDIEKNQKCERDGIKLFRIRDGLPSLNSSSIDYSIQDNQSLEKIFEKIFKDIVDHNIDIDLCRDAGAIENLREYTEKNNAFLFSNPEIASEWNYIKNGTLRPENFTFGSNKKVWWECSKGHEWQATIAHRFQGQGCPYCVGNKVLKGYNDLQTSNPTLAKEWNYDKNRGLIPENVLSNSNKKVWWKCGKGHEWQATIVHRNNGTGCPYCSGRYVITGLNDLQTVNPTLAQEWNDEKNNGLTPSAVSPNSGKRVWWMCSNGHEWQAIIKNRSKGRSCPYCVNQKILKSYNDLQTVNPNLADEWNYDKNCNLKPEDYVANSEKKVWWKCEKGHEWQATIANRNHGRGCPYCSDRKIMEGYNDLLTISPNIAKEWNHEKNNFLTPADVMPGSGKKVWWKCSKGHEWQARIYSRNRGSGCPECARNIQKKD